MAAYNFTKTPLAVDSLEQEIRSSAIVTALDYVTALGSALSVVFKAVISQGDETILNTIVTNHAGIPLPLNTPISVSTTNPKTEDMRDIVTINRIPLGYTICPTSRGDNIANGTYGDGEKLILDTNNATRYLQFLDHWYGVGGRVIWESATLLDEMNAILIAPATSGATQTAGNFNKVEIIPSSGLNIFVPAAPGQGAWDMDLTAKLTNTQILKCVPVPVAGNTGFFDYNSDTNVLTVNSQQQGGYNLYDFNINLFRFANTILGRKQDGAESHMETTDVVGKLLYNCWKIKFTIDAVTAGAKCGVIITIAIKKNI